MKIARKRKNPIKKQKEMLMKITIRNDSIKNI